MCMYIKLLRRVQSCKDLSNIIISHFLKYYLITQKQSDFIVFTSIINILEKGPLKKKV
jgi:hypothetical protein